MFCGLTIEAPAIHKINFGQMLHRHLKNEQKNK